MTTSRKKGVPQKDRLLAILRRKRQPVWNHELNRIAFRYGARLYELRKRGFVIEVEMHSPGLYSYRLIKEPNKV